MAYAWDNPDNPARPQDNKGGDVPGDGYFGCMFLNHTTDPSGATAPPHVGITSFKFYQTSAAGNMQQGADVSVTGNTFTVTVAAKTHNGDHRHEE